jgi:RNA polymerase sigma-70 factor (ECF subfamily)
MGGRVPEMTDSARFAEATGQEGTFEALYHAHHRAVLAYCARRAAPWDAWDAASDVFVVAWRRLEAVPAPPEARAWLIGVAFKVLANQRRGARRRLRLLTRIDSQSLAVSPPEEQILRAEQDREVIEALALLKPSDREIVTLTLWDELSPVEIAQVLGISRDAVDQRYSRAKRRLSRHLGVDVRSDGHATHTQATEGGVT